MWKRRAKYDPMKAAMEGKKKQEEAKRTAQQQQQDILSKSCERLAYFCFSMLYLLNKNKKIVFW
jgi:hypothetical protein